MKLETHAGQTKNRGRPRIQKQIELCDLPLGILFLLRALSLLDHLTEGAGVLPIERFDEGLFECRILGIAHRHSHPSDRLKNCPMCADGKNESTDD
jgi:hypothetical protein